MAGHDEPTENAALPPSRRAPPTIDLPASEVPPPHAEASDPPGSIGNDADPGDAGDQFERRPARGPWPMLAALLAVVLIAVFAGGAWWQIQQGQSRDADVANLKSRLSAMESSLASATRANAASGDLAARIAKLEGDAAAPASDVALKQRVDALEKSLNALQDAVSKSGAPSDDSAGGLRALQARMDTLEQSVADLRTTVSRLRNASSDSAELQRTNAQVAAIDKTVQAVQRKMESQAGTVADRTLRGAILAMALRDAAARGAPFTAELNAAKSGGLAAPPEELASFAPKGLPSARALADELLGQIDKVNAGQETGSTTGTILDRLKARASHLVRIRPAGDTAGDNPDAVLDRAAAKARDTDIAGALEELQRLPDASRAPFDGWIAKAKARQAALAAAQTYATQALHALVQPETGK